MACGNARIKKCRRKQAHEWVGEWMHALSISGAHFDTHLQGHVYLYKLKGAWNWNHAKWACRHDSLQIQVPPVIRLIKDNAIYFGYITNVDSTGIHSIHAVSRVLLPNVPTSLSWSSSGVSFKSKNHVTLIRSRTSLQVSQFWHLTPHIMELMISRHKNISISMPLEAFRRNGEALQIWCIVLWGTSVRWHVYQTWYSKEHSAKSIPSSFAVICCVRIPCTTMERGKAITKTGPFNG